MFVDRERELDWLESGWRDGRPQFRILYGRRRVGKSALLDRFAEGKRTILYQAVQGTAADQLRDLTRAVLEREDDPVLRAAPLANWEQAFATFARMAQGGPLLVVLDEYQYAAQSDPTLASVLQRWWSRQAVSLPIYLVLCGSYIRFFVDNVLSGPAYGRNTGALQLQPLGYRQMGALFPSWSHEDQIRAWAVVGGVPHYALQLEPDRSLEWNIQNRVLGRGAVLYQEAEILVREELQDPRTYYSILRAVAAGCTRVGQIGARIGVSSSQAVMPYLSTLQALGLVTYQQPLAGKARRGIWIIADPYLRFWFRFVLPHRTQLEHGADAGRVYRDLVAQELDHFVSKPAFEEICRAWVLDQIDAGQLPDITTVGAWWGSIPAPTSDNPRNQAEGELEIVGAGRDGISLFAEAKWTREPVDFPVLNHLREVSRCVPGAAEGPRFLLFGREFAPRLRSAAASECVTLVSPAELYGE